MQVVIWSRKKKSYLRRRGSYSTESWTKNLQLAQVMSEVGARSSMKKLQCKGKGCTTLHVQLTLAEVKWSYIL